MDEDKTSENETSEENNSEEKEEETSEKTKEEQDKNMKSALAQKEHFRGKFEKEEKEKKDLQARLEEMEEEKEKKKTPISDEKWKEKIEFATSHPSLPEKYFDELSAYAGGRSVPLEEAHKGEAMKAVFKAFEEKGRRGKTTPEPSSRSFAVEGKSLAEMSNEELEKNYGKARDKIIASKRGKTNFT